MFDEMEGHEKNIIYSNYKECMGVVDRRRTRNTKKIGLMIQMSFIQHVF
jgi:hypothetical protein